MFACSKTVFISTSCYYAISLNYQSKYNKKCYGHSWKVQFVIKLFEATKAKTTIIRIHSILLVLTTDLMLNYVVNH